MAAKTGRLAVAGLVSVMSADVAVQPVNRQSPLPPAG
jgi:hypothetical protein